MPKSESRVCTATFTSKIYLNPFLYGLSESIPFEVFQKGFILELNKMYAFFKVQNQFVTDE